MSDESGSAFPTQFSSGVTVRDFFAAAALTGMHTRIEYDAGLATPEQRASLAYIEADAMLEARKRGQ